MCTWFFLYVCFFMLRARLDHTISRIPVIKVYFCSSNFFPCYPKFFFLHVGSFWGKSRKYHRSHWSCLISIMSFFSFLCGIVITLIVCYFHPYLRSLGPFVMRTYQNTATFLPFLVRNVIETCRIIPPTSITCFFFYSYRISPYHYCYNHNIKSLFMLCVMPTTYCFHHFFLFVRYRSCRLFLFVIL